MCKGNAFVRKITRINCTAMLAEFTRPTPGAGSASDIRRFTLHPVGEWPIRATRAAPAER
jgi:hypothetical protein